MDSSFTLSLKIFGADKTAIFGYHLTKLIIDAKAGKLNLKVIGILGFLQKASSLSGKGMDAEKQLNETFGIDLNLPKDGKEAVTKTLKSVGEDPSKINQ